MAHRKLDGTTYIACYAALPFEFIFPAVYLFRVAIAFSRSKDFSIVVSGSCKVKWSRGIVVVK
jgi:hypothetical protein